MQMINSCGFFDLQMVKEKYENSDSLADYMYNSLNSSLIEMGILDDNSTDLLLGDKLLYGLFTFFDLYRKDWQRTSVLNLWGRETNDDKRKILGAQQVYYSSLKKSLKFSYFFSKYMRKNGFQKWSNEDGDKLYFTNYYYENGEFIHGDKILCLEKRPYPLSKNNFINTMLGFKNGNIDKKEYISFITDNFFNVDESFHADRILNELEPNYRSDIEAEQINAILNFLLFQSYTVNWKYLYVFSPSINILSGSLFLYLFEDLTDEENIFFHFLSNRVFSNMMIAFSYANKSLI